MTRNTIYELANSAPHATGTFTYKIKCRSRGVLETCSEIYFISSFIFSKHITLLLDNCRLYYKMWRANENNVKNAIFANLRVV